MVSEIIKVYLWKSIELGAGDPILFENKMCYNCYSHSKEVRSNVKGS
jgi:hypothetical protein